MARRFALLLSILLLSSIQVLGQDEAKPKPKEREAVQVVAPTERLSKRICLVVDVSSSMDHPDRVRRVLKLVRKIAEQPLDDYELAIVAFNDVSFRWPGVKDAEGSADPVPWGWGRLPSKTTVDSAQKWLSEQKCKDGTNPEAGFEVALGESRSDLSVVFITDAGYSHGVLEAAIEKLQEKRVEKGLGEAVILSYALGPMSDSDKDHMTKLATKWKGGYFWENDGNAGGAPVSPWRNGGIGGLPDVIAPIATPD